MNRDQAYSIVRQTFTHSFDKNRFSNFSQNILNHLDGSKAAPWSSQYVKDAFKGHIHRYERLGTYTSPQKEKLDVLIVHLTSESKLERARTAIRNFVADHLKTRDEKDAALVAFVSPSETTWRFSFIKMEYATVEKDSGKVGVETHLTPARRLSYIVGEGESCHTAQTRFLNLLQDTETDPTLADIEEAFSVETVTKEFFTKYAKLFGEIHEALDQLVVKYHTIRDDFTAKGVNTVDFAKKLMGQVVFLYFLQKKGWLGVARGQDWGRGPRDFLRRLANGEYGRYDNFFNDILEPLFYDTLATDRGHEAWCNRFNCRIPFLNGGLFEPLGNYDWRKTDIVLPNKLFTNAELTKEGDAGTGVLDVFDRYNFTVNEAEPLEKEVAIDPEMLGKVFENLIEDNRRKGLGAYYTPREIVHYMCQESLINYLDTAINTVSEPIAADKPGRGKLFGPPEPEQVALRIAEYRELVPRADIETFVHLGEQISHYESVDTSYRVKMPKGIAQQARLIDDKLAEITICDPAVGSGAFPVGMMTEIVRSRCALTPYFNDVHERTPYHFKRHAIQNCLYGVDIDVGAVEIAKLRLWLSLVVDEEDPKQIKPLPNLDYKIVPGNSLIGFPFKSQRLHEIEKLKLQFFDESDHEKKADLKSAIDRNLHDAFASSKASLGYAVDFDFEVYFSEVFRNGDGFDITVANPPYVRQEKLKDQKKVFAQHYQTYTGIADLYVYFYEKGIKLLKPGGTIAYISSNKFFRAGYGEKLRRFLTEKTAIINLIDFGDLPVFEATTYPCVLVAKKLNGESRETVVRARTIATEDQLRRFEEVFRSSAIEMRQSDLNVEGWRIEDRSVLALLEKIKKAGPTLAEYVDGKIYRGITTGYNEAFVIDEPTRNRLIKEDKKSAEVIKSFLRGRDIKRYAIEDPNLYLIFTRRGIDIKNYPAIEKYLKQFKHGLTPGVSGGRKPGTYKWYEIQDSTDYWQEFEKAIIVMQGLMIEPTFVLSSKGYYLNAPANFIGSKEQYLLGVLNSKVLWLFHRNLTISVQQGFLRIYVYNIEKLPIATPLESQRSEIESCVEKILKAKQRDPKADTIAWEGEIDRLVYELYELTPTEIKLVEEGTRK